MGKIIAIGGGEIGRPKENGDGFYPVETLAIDKEIIALSGKKKPNFVCSYSFRRFRRLL